MNWVGGARNRIKIKNELKMQREFFKKRRLEMAGTSREPGSCTAPTLSRDLITFNLLQLKSRKGGKEAKPTKVIKGDLDKYNRYKTVHANIPETPLDSITNLYKVGSNKKETNSDKRHKIKTEENEETVYSNCKASKAPFSASNSSEIIDQTQKKYYFSKCGNDSLSASVKIHSPEYLEHNCYVEHYQNQENNKIANGHSGICSNGINLYPRSSNIDYIYDEPYIRKHNLSKNRFPVFNSISNSKSYELQKSMEYMREMAEKYKNAPRNNYGTLLEFQPCSSSTVNSGHSNMPRNEEFIPENSLLFNETDIYCARNEEMDFENFNESKNAADPFDKNYTHSVDVNSLDSESFSSSPICMSYTFKHARISKDFTGDTLDENDDVILNQNMPKSILKSSRNIECFNTSVFDSTILKTYKEDNDESLLSSIPEVNYVKNDRDNEVEEFEDYSIFQKQISMIRKSKHSFNPNIFSENFSYTDLENAVAKSVEFQKTSLSKNKSSYFDGTCHLPSPHSSPDESHVRKTNDLTLNDFNIHNFKQIKSLCSSPEKEMSENWDNSEILCKDNLPLCNYAKSSYKSIQNKIVEQNAGENNEEDIAFIQQNNLNNGFPVSVYRKWKGAHDNRQLQNVHLNDISGYKKEFLESRLTKMKYIENNHESKKESSDFSYLKRKYAYDHTPVSKKSIRANDKCAGIGKIPENISKAGNYSSENEYVLQDSEMLNKTNHSRQVKKNKSITKVDDPIELLIIQRKENVFNKSESGKLLFKDNGYRKKASLNENCSLEGNLKGCADSRQEDVNNINSNKKILSKKEKETMRSTMINDEHICSPTEVKDVVEVEVVSSDHEDESRQLKNIAVTLETENTSIANLRDVKSEIQNENVTPEIENRSRENNINISETEYNSDPKDETDEEFYIHKVACVKVSCKNESFVVNAPENTDYTKDDKLLNTVSQNDSLREFKVLESNEIYERNVSELNTFQSIYSVKNVSLKNFTENINTSKITEEKPEKHNVSDIETQTCIKMYLNAETQTIVEISDFSCQTNF